MKEVNVVSFQRPDDASRDRLGSIELGCFRLKEIIGRGSYGTSYLAEQIGFDRDAVVKIAHAELFRSRNADLVRRRFSDELRAATRVQHPHLVTLYTAGETADGVPAIAMELAAGHPLEDLLAAHPQGLPGELIERAFEQLGSALAALHDAGVVHRDLSPSNVMLDVGPPAKIKVLDFGVAKLRGRPGLTYGAVGTPRYMAPEQVIGRAVPASDVFAMGAMLWWALTGEEYRGDTLTIEDLHHAALDAHGPVDPRMVAPDLPAEISSLVTRMLAHAEHDRPTAVEFGSQWRRAALGLRSLGPRPRRRTPPSLPPVPGVAIRAVESDPAVEPRSIGAPPRYGSLPRPSLRPLGQLAERYDAEQALHRSTTPTELDAIDRSVLDELHRTDPGAVGEAIEQFVGQTPESLARIEEAHRRRDARAILDACRSLSTGARALGANRLARLAHAASELVREDDLDRIPAVVTEMEREYGLVFRALMPFHAHALDHGAP